MKKTTSKINELQEFYIIENDENKDYGVSFVYPDENTGYKIQMYQDRLQIVAPDVDSIAVLDAFEPSAKCYMTDGEATSLDAMNAHLDFWLTPDMSQEQFEKITVYPISEMSKILFCGFSEERIIFDLWEV